MVTTALGFTPYNSSNPAGYISGINSSMVTTALGFTPYNASNPAGYITSSGSISGSAGSLSNTTNFFIGRGDVAADSIDSAIGLGVWNQLNVGDSDTLLVFGAGGSTSTVQQRFRYTGSMEFRNRTDSANWQPWKLVLTNANFTSFAMPSGSSATNTVDVRAPIYYDSNDTAYYLDPAGSTALFSNGLVVAGTQGFQSRTYTTGARNRIWSFADADSFGLSYFQGTSGIDGQDTIGIHFGTATAAASTLQVNRAGYTTSLGSLRAPIFYDSDNTGYYLDPAGSSVLGATTLQSTNDAQLFLNGNGSSWAGISWTDVSATDYMFYNGSTSTFAIGGGGSVVANKKLHINGSVTIGSGLAATSAGTNSLVVEGSVGVGSGGLYQPGSLYSDANWGMIFRARQASPNTAEFLWTNAADGTMMRINAGGSVVAAADFRAPIFYDTNDTSYYLDPNSTSVLNAINVWGEIGPRRGDGQSLLRSYNITAGGPLQFYLDHSFGNVNIGNNRGAVFADGTYWQIANSVRSPIFYDSDNTGFYTDPASTSLMANAIIAGRAMTFAMFYEGFTLDANTMSSNATGFTYSVNAPYVGPIARFSTGGSYDLWLNAPYIGGSGLAFRTRNGDAGTINAWQNLAVYGTTLNAGALFATIYYDGNDSAYYVDPNGASALSGALLIGPTSSGAYTRFGAGAGNTTYSTISASNGNLHIDSQAGYDLYLNWYTARPVWSEGGAYFPIYYDRNNTGFYLDPNSTSYCYQYGGPVTYGSYGSISVSGVTNGYAGIAFPSTSSCLMMGNGINAPAGFYFGNDGWGLYSYKNGGTYTHVVYDLDNTAYYFDGSSTGTSLNVAGAIVAAGNVTAFSDIRVKDNVEQIEGALDRVSRIRGVTYTRTDLDDKERRYGGVIAQEIEAVLPEAIFDSGDKKAVDYNATIGLLIEAIKELKTEVTDLKQRIEG
jgi:hypothetical protein